MIPYSYIMCNHEKTPRPIGPGVFSWKGEEMTRRSVVPKSSDEATLIVYHTPYHLRNYDMLRNIIRSMSRPVGVLINEDNGNLQIA